MPLQGDRNGSRLAGSVVRSQPRRNRASNRKALNLSSTQGKSIAKRINKKSKAKPITRARQATLTHVQQTTNERNEK
jgi:hypothetical protein